jgi:hypothetical protein
VLVRRPSPSILGSRLRDEDSQRNRYIGDAFRRLSLCNGHSLLRRFSLWSRSLVFRTSSDTCYRAYGLSRKSPAPKVSHSTQTSVGRQLCLLTEGDSLANSVIFPDNRLTETRELAYPSPGAKAGNSVTFSTAGVRCAPAHLAARAETSHLRATYLKVARALHGRHVELSRNAAS